MIFIITKKGRIKKLKEDSIREQRREARGVRGLRLELDDEVVGIAVTPK